ncbi:MAG TPA: hypothetical protein PLL30_08265 [Candidatus Krumholzibacteria bacterium]|nr:hypothetical protein [Candidatus Krumholzibacteria bacterium]HPD71751.1 hypothetical protein [Candidatus Krumholzibacteria bacterium]HRY41316.1 hypothetical protein [Candidatus Krumholzibacteria bacterium]
MVQAGDSASRHRFDAVAEAFLPAARTGHEPARDRAGCLYAAAPGAVDTAAILASFGSAAGTAPRFDLGGEVWTRLARWERTGWRAPFPADQAILLWCPRAAEGTSLTASMVLGRLGALIRPRRLTILWHWGESRPPGRLPDAVQRARAESLAGAAVPGAAVTLHCVGWISTVASDLGDLAQRYR